LPTDRRATKPRGPVGSSPPSPIVGAVANTVVLVHGAWHGAWCWERVVPGLNDRGLRATAIDLPGHGADSGPFGDLHGDAARVLEALDQLDEPAIVVGHSYGGAVVTEAGDHPMVEGLVFVAALVLDAGESCMEAALGGSEAAGISWEERPNLAEGFIVGSDDTVTLDPKIAAVCLFNDCDDQTVEWALEHLGPHPFGNLRQRPRRISWRTKPSTYVVCSDDLAVHPDLQRVLAKRCTSSIEMRTGHSPFLSRPELIVAILENVATQTR
jgi:pimeloyl-ACP methyl ester carboxylesterase